MISADLQDYASENPNATMNPKFTITNAPAVVRTFTTGATRDVDANKLDFEGFLSPLVLDRYARYMHKNRLQKDGNLRASDNWQKGIPKDAYMKSGWRHFFEWWSHHRGFSHLATEALEDALCAILFNVSGYLHEGLKEQLDI